MDMPTTKAELLKFLEEKLPDNLVAENMSFDVSEIVSSNYNCSVFAIVREGIHITFSYLSRAND